MRGFPRSSPCGCEGEDVQERANEAVPISRFEVDENLVEGIDDNQVRSVRTASLNCSTEIVDSVDDARRRARIVCS